MLRDAPFRSHLPTLAGVVLCGLCLTAGMFAQTLSDYQVKAAYVYNFAKFIEWPAQKFASPTSPFRFCILDDYSFETELNRIVKDKSVAGRPIEVRDVRDGPESRNCHILFVNAAQSKRLRVIVEATRGAGVLSVGETEDFIDQGGIVKFVADNGR
ncbi:MAG TPA: YfiR family protein, partial [Terriglobales bacterium]|nr:YfiR family protein [Terriglobales bacterium]